MDIEMIIESLANCASYDYPRGVQFDRDRARAILKVVELEALLEVSGHTFEEIVEARRATGLDPHER